MKTVRIVTPTGHLGTTPLEKASFERGCAASPDFIVADSGSADIGPYPLGADKAASDEVWQRHDIEAMLLAARRLGIPLILGSASDTGIVVEVVCDDAARAEAICHIEVVDPRELFRSRFETVGAGGRA